METNHYHPNGGTGAQVKCRDCGYKWFEANPEQEQKKVKMKKIRKPPHKKFKVKRM